jgi:hypothetical protein
MKENPLLSDPMPWLLEKESPGARYLARRDILQLPGDSGELRAARRKAHKEGPIAAALSHMDDSGYWATTRSTGRWYGRSSCWLNWGHTSKKTNGSPQHVHT